MSWIKKEERGSTLGELIYHKSWEEWFGDDQAGAPALRRRRVRIILLDNQLRMVYSVLDDDNGRASETFAGEMSLEDVTAFRFIARSVLGGIEGDVMIGPDADDGAAPVGVGRYL